MKRTIKKFKIFKNVMTKEICLRYPRKSLVKITVSGNTVCIPLLKLFLMASGDVFCVAGNRYSVLQTSVTRLESGITCLIYNVTRCYVFKTRNFLYRQQEEATFVPTRSLLQYSDQG